MDKVKKKNLDNRARDTIWSILNTYGTSIVSFFFVLVLTRLITPETFGLVAKFISIILVINVIVEAGRTTYLSRKKNILNKDLDYSIIWILIRSLIALILFNLFKQIKDTEVTVQNFINEEGKSLQKGQHL